MFVVAWTFDVRAGREDAFRHAYGPRGPWFELFRRWPGFIETELIELRRDRFMTLDRWVDEAAYERFMAEAEASYSELDRELAELCSHEVLIGRGTVVSPRSP